jgi:DNA polymerase-3 subunit alpha
VIESLIKAGAMDSLGERGTLLNNVNSILSLAQKEQRLRETGQSTMFDLWGQTVPVPLPDLDLQAVAITTKEKAEWEKELLGISLSKQPFTSGRNDPGTTLCGEIDNEMDGQSVTTIGEVALVSQLFTREHKPFVKATLEDISGSVEVTVWPKAYESNKELWQEGNIVQVEGKVRVRDDRAGINCDSVQLYQTEVIPADESAPVEPVKLPSPEKTTAEITPTQSKRLVVSITQTDDKAGDIECLHKVIDILQNFPGEDEVSLSLESKEETINLKLTSITVKYGTDLRHRLVELLGEDKLTLLS